MSNVISMRPVQRRVRDELVPAGDYFAIVDEYGRERPIMADSIEKALFEAEALECLGTADTQTSFRVLRLVGNHTGQDCCPAQ